MSIHITSTGDMDATVRALARAIGTVEAEVQRSVTVEALDLKRKWQQDAANHGHLGHLPRAVEVANIPDGKRISFGDGNQGALAHIANFGSYRSAPVMNVFAHVPPAVATLRRFMGEIGDPW